MHRGPQMRMKGPGAWEAKREREREGKGVLGVRFYFSYKERTLSNFNRGDWRR